MSKIHLLPTEDRKVFFDEAVNKLGIVFPIIEKDFWVVWTLERLFSLDELKSHLTFKGGTSLSKVYGLIERFSEDIDVSIEKDFLGFGAPENDPEKATSSNKQKAALEKLSKACSSYVQNEMATALKKSIADEFGTTKGWQVIPDAKDPQALIFEYPNITPRGDYIHQAVKIEMGARSEHWPVSDHAIQSFVKKALAEKVTEPEFKIRVLNAERTFWEKATLLHQYAHLPEGKPLPPRLSRHLYDFFQLLGSPIKEKALRDLTLLDRVADHKNIYFASAWANYETARKGTLKLSPHARVVAELERDYDLMAPMFYGEAPRPKWELILKTIEEFERGFNGGKNG
jgi:predicted nucleotidyltransferase component of viral defense system